MARKRNTAEQIIGLLQEVRCGSVRVTRSGRSAEALGFPSNSGHPLARTKNTS